MQSRSIVQFKPFTIKRRTEDELPQHVKGAATWREIDDKEGYWVFDTLEQNYLAIEYEELTQQWYFIGQDSRTGHWVATQPVPSSYQLGRQSIWPIGKVTGIDVDDSEAKGHTQSFFSKTGITQSLAQTMSMTQTMTAAALTLAGMRNPTQSQSFFTKPSMGKSGPGGKPPGGTRPPGGGGPTGGRGTGPPRGGGGTGPPGGGGGGGPPGGPPGGAGGGGGNGKLGGNPPSDFDGNRALADAFINEFNLYCLSNINAEQMMNPMKCVALMLGFIKGPNVKDWTKCWTNWMINEFTTGRPTMDKHYWSEVARGFQIMFQDTGARERAEDKLRHLAFIPNEVDTFITQFESLATKATYDLDAQPMLSLYVSKLPFKMVDHIYKVVRLVDFQGWVDATHQYHQDNTAVQNIRGIFEETPKKTSMGGTRPKMSAQLLAQILGVKMPTPNPNAMDTRADRTRSNNNWKKGTRGHATNTEDETKDWCKKVQCFGCNQFSHLKRECPNKDEKGKKPVKAHVAKTDTEEEEFEEGSLLEELTSGTEDVLPALISFLKSGRALPKDKKFYLMRRHAEGKLPKELDF